MVSSGNLHAYRDGAKILDVTLRDGGIVNNFYFTDEFVKALYRANLAAGVDVMEFGYKVSEKLFDRSKFGKWKFCREEDIRGAIGEKSDKMLVSVMADVGRVDLENEVIPKKDSYIDLYRIATYVHQIPSAVEMIEYCHKMGYKTSCNIMAISKVDFNSLKQAVETVAKSPADVIVIVDSFGALYPDEIRAISETYLEIGAKYGKQIGIHAHNNQQLAFANTIEAYAKGVNWLDGTVCGMGRGAGNCFTESLLGYFKNSAYKIEPILAFIREYMNDLKKKESWGYDTPYLLTGVNNVHPYAAIDFLKADRDDYEQFLKEIQTPTD